MRVTGVGYQPTFYQLQAAPRPSGSPAAQGGTIMTKDEMKRLLGLVLYNSTGMAYKLARIAREIYTGLQLDMQA